MSTEVKAKVEKLARLQAEAQEILGRFPDGLPGDQEIRLTVMMREAKTLQGEIRQERDLEAKRADLADLDKFLNEPERKLPHGLNGDDDDRKALSARGWESKGGILYAPTSLGTTQAMFPEDVLFGEIPADDEARATFYKTTRAAFAPEYKAAYAKHIRLTARFGDAAMAMQQLTGDERKALSEGSDPAGGFLVPPDMQAEVLARVAQQAVMRRLARVINTNRDSVKFPAVQPHSTSGSIYSSGFVGGWVGETPSFTETDPAFQQFEITIKKARVATKLSNDFIADAAVNILAWLAQNGAENMALVLDNGFINGDGSALQPLGLLNCGASTVDVEGSTANTISNTTSNTGSYPKLIDVQYAIPAQYVGRASWLLRRAIEGKIRKLVDGSGRPIWFGTNESGLASTPRTMLGDPIYNSDFMPNDGTDANKVVVYGDLSQYIIAERAQINSVVLRERFADTDQTGFIMFARVGGGLWNTDAIRIGIV